MEPNRREFQKQCAFQSFCKRVLHNEACNATTKSGDAGNGKYRFATLPCMRNGSFTPLTSIFKTKKLNRVIKWQEKR